MTHRTLEDDELFEIRIDRIVEKWIGETFLMDRDMDLF